MKVGFIHPLIAVAVQIAFWALFGNWWFGVAACSFFLGRELAQAEYRWIENYGQYRRANMPWWGAFDPRVWTLHSLTDWLIPLGLTLAIALISPGV